MAAKTRKAIEKSFLKIAGRKPVDKITVKEIVEDCGINRNSFYYHFQDLPDLIEKILEEQITNLVEGQKESNFNDLIHIALHGMQRHQTVLRNIYNSRNRHVLEIHLLHLTEILVRNFLNHHRFAEHHLSDEYREAIVRAYTWDIIGMIVDWMNSGSKMNLVEEFDRVYTLRQGTMKLMVQRALLLQQRSSEKV